MPHARGRVLQERGPLSEVQNETGKEAHSYGAHHQFQLAFAPKVPHVYSAL